MCSAIGAIGAIGEGVLTNRIRLCILDMSVQIASKKDWLPRTFLALCKLSFQDHLSRPGLSTRTYVCRSPWSWAPDVWHWERGRTLRRLAAVFLDVGWKF